MASETRTQEAIKVMADKAIELGETTGSDDTGIVRAIVAANGLSFNAWLCVCCEIADRNAQKEGFKNQSDRAGQHMQRSEAYINYRRNQFK